MIRRGLSGLLVALILCVSVLGAVLDAAPSAPGNVVESRHDPASCTPAHDHLACTQHSLSDLLVPRPGVRLAPPPAGAVEAPVVVVWFARSGPRTEGHPSRAPPRR